MTAPPPDAMLATPERVLVIKLGALGDFVQATGPFAAIHTHHPEAHLTLLTTVPLAKLAAASPWFDRVCVDTRPSPLNLSGWLELLRLLRGGRFDRVYDLQTSDRSSFYYHLMRPRLGSRKRLFEWCGIARGCSHPHHNPARELMHTLDRHIDQLGVAGINYVPPPSVDWIDADVSRFGLRGRYVLMVPGGSAHRRKKRWPARHFATLARELLRRGETPVLLGSGPDRDATAAVAEKCPEAYDLTGQTSLKEIVALAKGAVGAVGSDTGPMHLIAAAGAPSVVLFSEASDPQLCAPRGPNVAILQKDSLSGLAVAEVDDALRLR